MTRFDAQPMTLPHKEARIGQRAIAEEEKSQFGQPSIQPWRLWRRDALETQPVYVQT